MRKISGIKDILSGKTGVLCDLWGVLHNGHKAFPKALEVLTHLEKSDISTVLLSNSPKPAHIVSGQIAGFGIDPKLFKGIVSSGELVREYLKNNPKKSLFFIGEEKDLPLFEGLKNPLLDDFRASDAILCTGFYKDWAKDPNIYEAFLSAAVEHQIPMICANPDLEVFIGDEKVLCAGTLAKTYEGLGGQVLWFGKPYPVAYEKGLALLGEKFEKAQILAIGDNLGTDILGGKKFGVETLFISEGLHGKFGSTPETLEELTKTFKIRPDYYMPRLEL